MPTVVLSARELSDDVFHVMLIHQGARDDPTTDIKNIRVCDTFDSVHMAKQAAHSCLFDAGYEREWFNTYDVKSAKDGEQWTYDDEVAVYAAARNEDVFLVKIVTTPNSESLKGNEFGLVEDDLYYPVVTEFDYTKDAGGRVWDSRVSGAYTSYMKAWNGSKMALGDEQDSDHRDWAEYNEAQDCEGDENELGENVVIHAVGSHGINYTVQIAKKQELEAVRVVYASKKLRT